MGSFGSSTNALFFPRDISALLITFREHSKEQAAKEAEIEALSEELENATSSKVKLKSMHSTFFFVMSTVLSFTRQFSYAFAGRHLALHGRKGHAQSILSGIRGISARVLVGTIRSVSETLSPSKKRRLEELDDRSLVYGE